MKKIAIVILLAVNLGGCSVYQDLITAYQVASSSIGAGRAAIRNYCGGIGTAANEAAAIAAASVSRDCKAMARVNAVVAANHAICTNVDTLTPKQLYTYGKQLVNQWKTAKDAVVAGC